MLFTYSHDHTIKVQMLQREETLLKATKIRWLANKNSNKYNEKNTHKNPL